MEQSLKPDAVFSKARELIRKRDYQKAISLLTALTSNGHDQPKVLETLAVAHSMQGEHELASDTLEAALRKSPGRKSTLVNLGAVSNRLRNYDTAVDYLHQAIKADWRCAEAYFNLGISYSGMKNYTEAKSMFQEAIRLQPEMVDAWLNLAVVFLETSNAQLAASWFRKVLERKPDHAKARKGLRVAESQLKQQCDPLHAFSDAPAEQTAQPAPPAPNAIRNISLLDRSAIQSSGFEIAQEIERVLEWFQNESDSLLHEIRKQVSSGIRKNHQTRKFMSEYSSQLDSQIERTDRLDESVQRMREYCQRYVQEN